MTTRFALALPLMLTILGGVRPVLLRDTGDATIEGGVFDRNGAVISKVVISVEAMESHTTTSVTTDDNGRYTITVKPGRYSLTQQPTVGWPIPNEHSSFSVSAGETVVINFRPRWVYSISDSVEGGHWIEKYDTGGSLPSAIAHYVQQPSGAIRDMRIQYLKSHVAAGVIEYSVSVTASFDRLTIYADDVVLYYPKKNMLTAQNVLLEDGKSTRQARTLQIDLSTGGALVDGAKYSVRTGTR